MFQYNGFKSQLVYNASTRDLNLSYGHTSRHIPFQLMLHYYIVNKIPDSQKRVNG